MRNPSQHYVLLNSKLLLAAEAFKDAVAAKKSGQWGSEVPVGTGQVNWTEFFELLAAKLPQVDAMIEREAGEQRVVDICTARAVVQAHAGATV